MDTMLKCKYLFNNKIIKNTCIINNKKCIGKCKKMDLIEKPSISKNINQCKHGEYTTKKFNGCKTCGNTVKVKCPKKKVEYVNSGGCNPQKCEYFEI